MRTTLTAQDFLSLSPLLIVLGAALLVLLVESFAEKAASKICALLTLLALAGALLAAYYAPPSNNPLLTPWLKMDGLSRLFTFFFLAIGIGATLLSSSFFSRFKASQGEYFFLLLSSLFGLILIGEAADFLTLFLGLETLSISLYVLCGYMKKWNLSSEASMKYFLMGALATAFLLYGIALIYGATGTTRFDALLQAYQTLSITSERMLFLSGIALVTLGLAFKAAVVPFHTWAPDVYEGASNPVTAFMAVGTKVGAFAALARVFLVALPHFDSIWNYGVALLAYLTMIYANFVALQQRQLRRFFAYSGIAHAGFLLIPFAAETSDSLAALVFYLVVYALATLGSFAAIASLDERNEGVMLSDLQGLFHRAPFKAGIFALCLLTLAGIPPTAGFFAKFYLFKVAFEAGYYGLVIVGLLMAILSAFYYLRIIAIMFAAAPEEKEAPAYSWPAALVGLGAFGLIALLSIYPAPLLNALEYFKQQQ
jgi:NADH-quinone oxidoreductase subunit N